MFLFCESYSPRVNLRFSTSSSNQLHQLPRVAHKDFQEMFWSKNINFFDQSVHYLALTKEYPFTEEWPFKSNFRIRIVNFMQRGIDKNATNCLYESY